MTEGEFWWQLRADLNSATDLDPLGYCDWIEPRRYVLGAPEGHIMGRIGFISDGSTNELNFDIAIPGICQEIEEIDWESLMRALASKGVVDIDHRLVTIYLGSEAAQDL